jgi:outer membrane protein assembly factor BamB
MGFKDFDRQGFARKMANAGNRFQVDWNRIAPSTKPMWSAQFKKAYAMAVCRNAILLAAETELVALNPADGAALWKQPLPKPPAPWGLAVDGAGRVVVTLTDGKVLCFGPSKGAL